MASDNCLLSHVSTLSIHSLSSFLHSFLSSENIENSFLNADELDTKQLSMALKQIGSKIDDFQNKRILQNIADSTADCSNQFGGKEMEKKQAVSLPVSPGSPVSPVPSRSLMNLAALNKHSTKSVSVHGGKFMVASVGVNKPYIPPHVRASSIAANLAMETSAPSYVRELKQTAHVSVDLDVCNYRGIPSEMKDSVKSIQVQFGVDPLKVETAKLPMYLARIPRLLIFLKDQLIRTNGIESVLFFCIPIFYFARLEFLE